ncbi:TPA: hypothetical protein GXZ54_06070 [bacterium]|nr:hypothetical protein [bacterium]
MKNLRNRIIAATPLISIFIFLLIGYFGGEWGLKSPWLLGCCAFLLIPINSTLLTKNWKRRLKHVIFLLSLLVFLILGIQFNLWHPGWVVFLSVFLYDIFARRKIDLSVLSTVTIIVLYLVIGFVSGEWNRAWIIILLIPIINILLGPHSILDFSASDTKKKFKEYIKKDIINIEIVENDEDKDEDD